MPKRSIQLLSPDKSRQLIELSERARSTLARYAECDVAYNAAGLQLLDEWIERHLQQFPQPSPKIRTLWGAFLGETFRRRFGGEWAINTAGKRPRLGILCPKGEQGLVFIDVMEQVTRRIEKGMNESLAFYYTVKGIEVQSAF